jgi:hypothetical protein
MKTPNGFAQVESGEDGAHYKGSNNVGLRVNTFDNVKGGSLSFWSEDLVRKLGARGYTLARQSPAKAKNGLTGTRFDFDYQPPGEKVEPRKYSVVLFVTDKHLVVMQLAGESDVIGGASAQLDTIASATKVRGCRAWTDICDAPQPAKLATPAPTKTKAKDAPDPASDAAPAPTGDEIAEEDTARKGG